MDASKHLKIAGALQIVLSLPQLLIGVFFIIMHILYLQEEGLHAFELYMLFTLSIMPFAGACLLWFGISLVMQKQWTRGVVGLIICALGLVSFPLGTAISGYTLWVLLQVKNMEEKTEQ